MENVLLLGYLLAIVAIAFGLSLTFVSRTPAGPDRKQLLDDGGSTVYSPAWFVAGGSHGGHCPTDGGGSAGCDGGGVSH